MIRFTLLFIFLSCTFAFAASKDTTQTVFCVSYGQAFDYDNTHVFSGRINNIVLEYGFQNTSIDRIDINTKYFGLGILLPIGSDYFSTNLLLGISMNDVIKNNYESDEETKFLYGVGLNLYPFKNFINIGISCNNLFKFNWSTGVIFRL